MSVAGLDIDEQAEHSGFYGIVAVNPGSLGSVDQGQVLVSVLLSLIQILDEFAQNVDGGLDAAGCRTLLGAYVIQCPFGGDLGGKLAWRVHRDLCIRPDL